MPETIKPFRATYYNPQIIKDFSSVTCPPYDVISKKQQYLLKRKSPYNFCNILLASGGDYKALGEKFRQWVNEKILLTDSRESVYLYEQKFRLCGKEYIRFGMLALLRMDGKKAIFPHEYTLKAPKEDRKRIIKEVEANLSPIFIITPEPLAMLRDIYKSYRENKPFLKFKDTDGNISRVWKIEDQILAEKICREFNKHKLVIADGHHRFEVSYNYYRKNKRRFKDLNYILAYITDAQEGLVILPTHRIVSVKNITAILGGKLKEYFYIKNVCEKELQRELKAVKQFSFGLYHRGKFYFLKLKNSSILDKIFKDSIYKELDTYILHQFVFPLCGIKGEIKYTHDILQAKKMTTKSESAFILRPTPLGAVLKIASQGYRLPQKSTYFYPKVFSGIVVRKFEKTRINAN
jgi:uncharacterized protein (DUF1015 family)